MMNAHPGLTHAPNWSCGCTRVYCPTALDAKCNSCGRPFQGIDSQGRAELVDASQRFGIGDDTPVTRNRQGGHITIPRALLYDLDLSPTIFRVAAVLYDHCAPGKLTARLSWAKIQERLSVSRHTVAKAIDTLHERRRIFDAVDRRTQKGGGHFYEYHLADVPSGPGTARKRKPRRKPYSGTAAGALPIIAASSSLPNGAKPEDVRCLVCYGTGMEVVEGRGARRCLACRP